MMSNGDFRQVVRALRDQGFTVVRTERGHWTVTRDGEWVAGLIDNHTDQQAFRSVLVALRKAGFTWLPRHRR